MTPPRKRKPPAPKPAALHTVTYRGPKDPSDPATRVVVAAGDTRWRFPLGTPVPGVPTPVVNELTGSAYDGHDFEITPQEG